MAEIDEVVKAVNDGNAVIGLSGVLTALKNGRINKVYLASNCPNKIKEELEEVTEDINISILKKNSEEIGALCKKLFNINVIGVKVTVDGN